MTSSHNSRAALALAWTWFLGVGAYMTWSAIGEHGLYQWLADLQIEHWGGYSPKLTAVLPALLLSAPALSFLRRRELEVRAAGPVEPAQRGLRNAWFLVFAGIVAACVAGGVWFLSTSVPSADSPATPIGFAALGRGPAPEGRVSIRGEIDPDATSAIERREGSRTRTIYYVAFRAEGESKSSPVRLFVERTAIGDVARTSQGFLPDQDGFLERNGLPPLARDDLDRRGIVLTEPYYVLRTGSDSPRDTYYIVAALAGLFGFGALVVGLAGLVQASIRLRRAHIADF